ncbi:MAG: penicillin-binding protein 2 [Desulfosporosinus sp.]
MEDKERKPYVTRLMGLGFVVVLVFFILGYNLWYLQIAQGAYYAAKAQGNVRKLVKVPPTRGDIIDRNGKLLVMSTPKFVLNLSWMDLQQSKGGDWKDVVRRLAGYIKPYWPIPNQDVDSIAEDIFANIQNHQWERYRPVTILNDVPQELQASIAEHQEELPGVSVDAIPVREYPEKILGGHFLGYVREISAEEIAQFNKNTDAQAAGFKYAQGDLVGKDGVEKSYDFWLRGVEGIQQVEVDNNARPLSKQIINPPVVGRTVQLTIDADLQKVVEDTLDERIAIIQKTNPNARAGAAVVLDVNTGKILAMASRPGMDPNELTGIITTEIRDKYWPQDPQQASHAASLNRVVSGAYAPGSVYKMVTAMAALQLKVTTPEERVNDLMSSLGGAESQAAGIAEWGRNYFGHVNLTRALAKSSNIYFQVMGRRVFEQSPEIMRQIGNEFGLGVTSGIDLPGEAKGISPSPEWKKAYNGPILEKSRDKKLAEIESKYASQLANAPDEKTKKKLQSAKEAEISEVNLWYKQEVYYKVDWRLYDSYNSSIGQGDNFYTPLQLANYVATIANGGKHYRPYIVEKILDPLSGETIKQFEPHLLNSVSVSPEVLDAVKKGMRAVMTGEGTANFLFEGYDPVPEFSGGGKTGTAQLGSRDTSGAQIFNGLFVAFAPYDHPQLAFAGVVEYGGHGGDTAGYVAKAAFMKYFGWKSANER